MIRAVDENSRSAGQLLDHAMVTFRVDHMESDIVDLSSLLAETVERFVPLAGLKGITLRLASLPESTELKCDPILLQNAIRNIIDNAIKYSPDESEIEISLTIDPQEYKITVTDQGRGFAEMEPNRLSERFSRGPNAGDVVGSGLGFTICKEVAIAHGGRLELKDNSGRGACVSLVLPH